MRVRDQGAVYSVLVSEADVYAFNRRWPCSTLEGPQRFEFEKRSGDLVDRDGKGDGGEAVALAEDAQRYGERKLNLPQAQRRYTERV